MSVMVMRWIGIGLAGVWAAALIVLGLWVWQKQDPLLALAPLAAGEFVVMGLVADPVCPRAHPAVTGFARRTVGLVVVLALGLAFWRLAAMM